MDSLTTNGTNVGTLVSSNPGLSLVVVILFGAIVLYAIKSRKNIKLGNLINITSESVVSEQTETRRTDTFESTDMIAVGLKIKSYLEKKYSYISELEKSVMAKQMNYAEERVLEIRTILNDDFARIMSKKNKDIEVRNSQEFHNYKMLVELMLDECVMEVLKKSLRENHIAQKTPEVWESFVMQKCEVPMKMFKDYLDIRYPDHMSVSRNEIDESYAKLSEQIKKLIVLIFRNARDVSIEVYYKTQQIKEFMDSDIERIVETHRIGEK